MQEGWRRSVSRALCAALVLLSGVAAAQRPEPAPLRLRIVGGLQGVNQYTRHEEPFWSAELPRLSAGRYAADIVPFDRAGLRAQEVLSLVERGVVPFGTVLLAVDSGRVPEMAALDLAGLAPDVPTLQRILRSARPAVQELLRERHGIELLALYSYPAQMAFCREPVTALSGLSGRRVRTSSVTQSDFMQALGARAVPTGFAAIVPEMRAGQLDCAVTGTMSGNSIGLHDLTSHLLAVPINWGLSIFVANGNAWRALPADLRELLLANLPRLEASIWAEAERETAGGLACNAGQAGCTGGRPGRMAIVRPGPTDLQSTRDILRSTVQPRWLQRCGAGCGAFWNQHFAPVTGITAPAP